jgi:ATP-binding cassette subfamily F protein 3
MENLIQLQHGSKAYGARALFSDASFSINENEHVGVIGPNGAGKTTLFRALIGEETLDSGQIIRSRQLRIGYLSQHDDWLPEETIEAFVERDAHLPIWELKGLARGLGLKEEDFAKPMSSFSGGYRMRAKLLRLLGQKPNLMLLDEPTNYLDLETLMVLEKFLQDFRGAFLLISHDREFLRRTTDHILEIENGDVTKFNGTIDDYFEQKSLLRAQLEARAFSIEEKRRQILDFVTRFGAKATKASQAQSRLKSLERLEPIEVNPLPVTAKIRIPPPAKTGKVVFKFQNVNLGYGEKRILEGVNLQIISGDHLAIVGLNGAGKSTLLKGLAGRLEPQSGTIEQGYGATFAYFAQHVAEELRPEETVLLALQRKAHPEVVPQQILDLAGALLFSGDAIQKPVRILSGGERSRVALGQVLLQKAACLILDEPTNHLDFQTVEALTQALQAYEGSIVVVSHDRSFIRRIGTKILEIHNGKANLYPGTYDDYVWSLEKGAYATLHNTEKTTTAVPQTEQNEKASFNYKERKKPLDRRLKQLETIIADTDRKLVENHERLNKLNQELNTCTGSDATVKITEMGKLQQEIETLESNWLEASEEKERVLTEIDELMRR